MVIENYRKELWCILEGTVIVDNSSKVIGNFEMSCEIVAREALACHERGGMIIFIGNGGSAAICNHCAIDWWKNGGILTRVFFGDSHLTCLANDFGYEFIFSKPIEDMTNKNDLLIAISSSGRSMNIRNGVIAARKIGMKVITLSGFSWDNPLKTMGDYNIYAPSESYGFVETTHGIILHAASDAFNELRNL